MLDRSGRCTGGEKPDYGDLKGVWEKQQWPVDSIAQQGALTCIFPRSLLSGPLAPAVQLWLRNRAVPQPSALAPRGVDWFVFPSVTLRNPEKLKCESFMLHERRGQQASQLGKKQ